MSVFDETKISTITCHTSLTKNIDTNLIVNLLPVKYDKIDQDQKDFNHPGIGGVILFLRYGDISRGNYGFLRKPKIFRNSISMDMSIASKMINIKFSNTSVHMCGIKSPDHIHEVMQHLGSMISTIKTFLDYPKTTKALKKYIEEFLNNVRGPRILSHLFFENHKGGMDEIVTADHSIVPYSGKTIPSEIEAVLSSFSIEKDVYSHLRLRLWDIYKLESVRNPTILNDLNYQVHISMQNYNYKIGFRISKTLLAKFIHSLKNKNIRTDFHPDMSKNSMKVMVWLSHSILYNFTIYTCGNVTQSGPSSFPIEAYNAIIPNIIRFRDQVECPVRNNKYKYKNNVYTMIKKGNVKL